MYSRRTVVQGMGLASVMPSLAVAQTATLSGDAATIEAWIKDSAHAKYFDPPNVSETQKGSLKLRPDAPDVIWAANFMAQLPTNLQPIDLAKRMMQTIPARYIMEWPPDTPAHKKPANPLIVGFFASTMTVPVQGDETAWCAAFACWTLHHSGRAYPNSAGSASFREFSALPKTLAPQVGDLVVFKHQNRPGNGHVAYFDGFTDATKRRVWCVGGNQGNRISRVSFPVAHSEMFVHSYHSVPKA